MSEKLLKSLNAYSGIGTFVGFLLAVVFFFLSIQTNLTALQQGYKENSLVQKEQVQLLRALSASLRDKSRDHAEFSRGLRDNSKVVIDIVRVLDRLVLTLDSIDKKIKG